VEKVPEKKLPPKNMTLQQKRELAAKNFLEKSKGILNDK
jgi:hypothetical protein